MESLIKIAGTVDGNFIAGTVDGNFIAGTVDGKEQKNRRIDECYITDFILFTSYSICSHNHPLTLVYHTIIPQ